MTELVEPREVHRHHQWPDSQHFDVIFCTDLTVVYHETLQILHRVQICLGPFRVDTENHVARLFHLAPL